MSPTVEPTGLPVEDIIDPLRAALAGPGTAVLQAPPGAGKTTVVPLRLLDEQWLDGSRIVVLEPRRLAARAAAARMASLLGERVGETVGYVTRDDRRTSPTARVEVVTEGILTRRLQHDPSLPGVGLVVLDEVHERNLQADLALALLLDIRPVLRPDLRLLAMSATIAAERFATLMGGDGAPAPVIVSEGRTHPVEMRWAPPPPRTRIENAAAALVERAVHDETGDLLVFLPGAAAIRRVESRLVNGGALLAGIDVRTLFGALAAADQDAALTPSRAGRRRVVLATDIAETSLTVQGVRVVVDAGLARTPRYDPRTGLTRLHTGTASKSSADQRAGRAGRTQPGVAYRLWSKLEHAGRRPFPEPEISAVDLAGLVLDLAVWGAEPSALAFVDQPPARSVDEARTLLVDLGALDHDRRPTAAGRAMAALPLHPRLARMVLSAKPLGLGWEASALAALLEDRDVLRGHPDELPVDIGVRLALITDPSARHQRTDRGALSSARRRAKQVAQRAGLSPGGRAEIDSAGRVLALAYPDRIAQSRGRSRVRLRGGGGAWVPETDPLAAERLLVVAELDAARGQVDARVRLAAAIDEPDVLAAAGNAVEQAATLTWDPVRDDLRQHRERRLGILVLSEDDQPAPPGGATTTALLERVRATRLGVLHWTDRARSLQHRTAFLRSLDPAPGPAGPDAEWPDLSDRALLATLDQWLAPLLPGATRRPDLETVDLAQALRLVLGRARAKELDRLAPTSVILASGRELKVDYADGHPAAAARVQHLFGTTVHPKVVDGRVPVVVSLLSPAGRPVQVTADLAGFWSGSWAEVRKDMAGRYPKHPWPANPADYRGS